MIKVVTNLAATVTLFYISRFPNAAAAFIKSRYFSCRVNSKLAKHNCVKPIFFKYGSFERQFSYMKWRILKLSVVTYLDKDKKIATYYNYLC